MPTSKQSTTELKEVLDILRNLVSIELIGASEEYAMIRVVGTSSISSISYDDFNKLREEGF